jgi:hypothetical protein
MKRLPLLGCLLVVAALSTAARADDERTERARILFNAGVQAYEAGQFLEAGQAFLEARKLLRKPELLFSAAQAFRRQFDVDQQPEHLRVAVTHYRLYLAEVKEGGRRLEAARALSDLAPFVAKLEGGPDVAIRFATRLLVSSPTPGAIAMLDGGPPRRIPLSTRVAPGRHRLLLLAPGYHQEAREVVAVEGRLVALDVPLRGKPARLEVRGASGAAVLVDGQIAGNVPLEPAVELDAGRHFVAVTKLGHEAYGAEVDFRHGGTTHIDLELPTTVQRRAAFALFGVAGAGLSAAGTLTYLAFEAQDEAESIEHAQATGTITAEQRAAHNDAIEHRDGLRTAAIATAGASGAVAITALLLLVIDTPAPERPRARPTPAPEPPAPRVDVLAGLTTATLRLSF